MIQKSLLLYNYLFRGSFCQLIYFEKYFLKYFLTIIQILVTFIKLSLLIVLSILCNPLIFHPFL